MQFFLRVTKTESAGLPQLCAVNIVASHTTPPPPVSASKRSVRFTCVYYDGRRRSIPGTFSPVEKDKVCRMGIFPVT